MNLNDLSLEAARTVLAFLTENSIITTEQLDSAMRCSVPTELKRITDTVHSLMCGFKHDPSLPGNKRECRYYEEEKLDSCWANDDHDYWLHVASEILNELNISSEDSFRQILAKARDFNSTLQQFKVNQRQAYILLRRMNGWEE
jgi:hypothetical protein